MLMFETDIPTIHKYVLSANDLLTVSNQGLVFIAQDRVMRRLEGRLDKKMPEYSASLYKYKLTMPDSDFNWKAWCLEEDFQTEKLNECFYFTLILGSKILSIRKSSDLEPLPKLHDSEKFYGTIFLDFEKLAKQYDAIELFVYGDFDLQGLWGTWDWDCDCVLVLNPDAVQKIPDDIGSVV